MKALVRLVCLCATASLSACGGGGGGAPDVPATPLTCEMSMRYADADSSGIQLAPTAPSFNFSFTNCSLLQLQKVTLDACVEHPSLSELTGLLQAGGTAFAALSLAEGQNQGNRCLASDMVNTRLLRFQISPPPGFDPSRLKGPWTLTITDNQTNNQSGHFVGWALKLEGLH